MHPVLFQLHTPFGDRPVYAYGLMLGLAVLLGWYALRRAGEELALEEATLENAYAATIVAALLGGRLGFVLANPRAFPTIASVLSPSHGGLLGSTAIAAGFIAAVLVARRSGAELSRLADAATPALALALVLTRIGCYLYGCDYGRRLGAHAPGWLASLGRFPRVMDARDPGLVLGSPAFLDQMTHSSSGLAIDATSALPVHPTQLYEALLGLVVFALSLGLFTRARRLGHRLEPGAVFVPCALVYGVVRLAIEPLRADLDRGFVGAISAPMLTTLAILGTSIAVGFVRRAQRLSA